MGGLTIPRGEGAKIGKQEESELIRSPDLRTSVIAC